MGQNVCFVLLFIRWDSDYRIAFLMSTNNSRLLSTSAVASATLVNIFPRSQTRKNLTDTKMMKVTITVTWLYLLNQVLIADITSV